MAMQLTFAQKMSLEVLQLNVQALEARVTEELESNPLLEKKTQELSEALVEPSSDPGEAPPEQDQKEAMMELVEPTLAEGNYLRPNSAEEDLDPLDLIADESPDFETAMAEQLEFHNLEPDLKIRVQTILSLLDHRGYLTEPLESCQTDAEDQQLRQLWPKALRFIQEQLEPAGMGASNLQECLGLQLLRRGQGLDVEESIISQHFDSLLHAKVLAIRPDVDIVLLSAGRDDQVKEGFQFTVFQGGTYKGKVIVESVYPNMCSARIVADLMAQSETIVEGDSASTRVY